MKTLAHPVPARARRLSRVGVGLLLAPAVLVGVAATDLVAAPAQAVTGPTTQYFGTAGISFFTVPAGVTVVRVTAVGGKGGDCKVDASGTEGAGGKGAAITAIVPVTPGGQLRIQVAGPGAGGGNCNGGAGTGGIGGGGNGGVGTPAASGWGGGGGGGASVVSTGTSAPTSGTALVVAGGGGGAAYQAAGGDAGGDVGTGGHAQYYPVGSGPGGGSQSQGGAGTDAEGGDATPGTAGAAFTGGNGGKGTSVPPDNTVGAGGGGGGAGWYGGGGAGGMVSHYPSSGGGGSSHVTGAGYVESPAAPSTADASVTVSYPAEAPPSAAVAHPADGEVYLPGASVDTSFSCAPGLGGTLASCNDSHGTTSASGGAGTLDTSVGGVHTYTVTATSVSGLTSTRSISYTVLTAPTADITGPASGGVYAVGQSVPTAFTCTEGDLGPGLTSCNDSHGSSSTSGGSGTLDTSTLGPHTYTATATSSDGLMGSASISYTVSKPVVSIKTGKVTVAHGKAKIVLGCAAVKCSGTLTLVHGKVGVGKASYSIKAGATKTIAVRVTSKGKSLLTKAKKHKLSIKATATLTGGKTAKRTIVLRKK